MHAMHSSGALFREAARGYFRSPAKTSTAHRGQRLHAFACGKAARDGYRIREAAAPAAHCDVEEDNVKGFFEAEQFESVKRHLPEYLQPLVEFVCITGSRRNEVTSLKRRQVDFRAGPIEPWVFFRSVGTRGSRAQRRATQRPKP